MFNSHRKLKLAFVLPLLMLSPDVTLGASASALPAQLNVTTGHPSGQAVVIAGRDGSQQLVVTLATDDGRQRDVTRDATYVAEPDGYIDIDATGQITPLAEGQVTVTVTHPEATATNLVVGVEHFDIDLPINFSNDVVPLFTKYGCNGGGCHGKSSGFARCRL